MRKRRAFTLGEMLVALAVTSLLMVLMMRMFMDSTAIWQQNEERLDTFREARAALQLMARELATVNAVPHVPDQFPVLALRHHPTTTTPDQVNEEVYALASVPNPRPERPLRSRLLLRLGFSKENVRSAAAVHRERCDFQPSQTGAERGRTVGRPGRLQAPVCPAATGG
ncbi:MAG: hypothetical protein QOE70_3384 [Chthoniobacter sp.]|jgi:type II secretory pathway pseudopilin PulG|nr:hypothetical protein [Chthoniobacter sp.]